MENNTIRKYVLEGLDCASCAGKIEDRINKLENVKHVTFDFVSKLLTIEHISVNKIDVVKKEAKDIIHKLEPHVEIIEKQSTKTYVYKLEGLACSSCAQKIEDRVHGMAEISEANVDFANARLILRPVSGARISELLNEIKEIVKDVEPGAVLITDNNVKASSSPLNTIDKKFLLRIGLGVVFLSAAVLGGFVKSLEISLFVTAYILIGGDVALKAIKNILRGQVFDENFLMTIATLGAFAINEYPEAVAVMLFYQVGELFQSMAVNKSRKSIGELLNIRPDYANLLVGEDLKKVSPEEVSVGNTILVKAGERVPLDGTILEGKSFLDTSALTGESVPREVGIGDTVLSGFINNNGLLKIEVNKTFGESTVSKILDLVQNASSRKAPTERFITRFARGYTPIVVVSAAIIATIPPLLIEGAVFSDWLYRALIFLVVSCPCALVVSIPLGFFGGIGGASKHGILVKGSNYLEGLNQVNTVVLDKTGTLTKGTFKVTKVDNINKKYSKEELLEYGAYAEHYSNHPIAKSIVKEYKGTVEAKEIESHEEIPGKGVLAKYKGDNIAAGNSRMMEELKIEYSEVLDIGTIVHIAVNNQYAGYMIISDEIKEDSKDAIKRLREKGVKNIVMLTGDHESVAKNVAEELGIDKYYAELLPQEKVEKLEELDKENTSKGKLVFVGDGVNDAPVLARADIGIAMGALGSDAAIEAADIVLMTDETSKIADSLVIAKKTRKIVWQNVVFALGVKGIVLIMGVMGIASMWLAVFADVGVALLAVLNAMRVLKIRIS